MEGNLRLHHARSALVAAQRCRNDSRAAANLAEYFWSVLDRGGAALADAVRHCARSGLQASLAMLADDDAAEFASRALRATWSTRAKLHFLSAAASHPRKRQLVHELEPKLPQRLLECSVLALCEPGISGHSTELYCQYMTSSTLETEAWLDKWVKPLIESNRQDLHHFLTSALACDRGRGEATMDFLLDRQQGEDDPHRLAIALTVIECKKRKTNGWKDYLTTTAFQNASNGQDEQVWSQ